MNNAKKQLYTAVMVLVVSAVLLGAGVWFFLLGAVNEEAEQYVENSLTLSEVEEKASLQNVLKKEFEAVEGEAEELENVLLPPDDQTVALTVIKELDRISAETGIAYETQNINPSGGELPAYSFNVRMTGGFNSVLQALRELRQFSTLISLQQVSLSTAEEGVSANISFLVYTK